MANNVQEPSLSPSCENDLGDRSTEVTTLDSTAVNGSNEGHSSIANNINSSDKPSPLSPEPLSTPPSPSAPSPSPSPSAPSVPPPPHQPHLVSATNAKKRKGRPRGSKNKPKPTIPREILDEFPKLIVLTVPTGNNIINDIINFGRKQNFTMLVHNALGLISEVTLFNRLAPSNQLSFKEKMQLLSLSGFYTNKLPPSAPKKAVHLFFNVQFSRERSVELFGGVVLDKLIAAEPVQVMAFVTKKLEYLRSVNFPRVNRSNTAYNLGLSIGPSSSSSMNVQPPAPSTDLSKFNLNKPTE